MAKSERSDNWLYDRMKAAEVEVNSWSSWQKAALNVNNTGMEEPKSQAFQNSRKEA